MTNMLFSQNEIEYLKSQSLARIVIIVRRHKKICKCILTKQ
jgi:hypothetical protein